MARLVKVTLGAARKARHGLSRGRVGNHGESKTTRPWTPAQQQSKGVARLGMARAEPCTVARSSGIG